MTSAIPAGASLYPALFWFFIAAFTLKIIFLLGVPYDLWYRFRVRRPASLKIGFFMGLPAGVVYRYQDAEEKHYSLLSLLDIILGFATIGARYNGNGTIPLSVRLVCTYIISALLAGYCQIIVQVYLMRRVLGIGR